MPNQMIHMIVVRIRRESTIDLAKTGHKLTRCAQPTRQRLPAAFSVNCGIGVAWIERAALFAVFRFAALEQRVNCHGVSVPKVKVLLEPGHDVARFDAILESTAIGEPFFGGKPTKVLGAFSRLCLDILEVRLRCALGAPTAQEEGKGIVLFAASWWPFGIARIHASIPFIAPAHVYQAGAERNPNDTPVQQD